MTAPEPGPTSRPLAQPVLAGVIASLVGFTSTFALVLAGLRAAGATPSQAASGLLALSLLMGAAGIWLSARSRMPISVAWSTPGAALLVAGGSVPGGYPAALGAFVICGALVVLAGLWRPLERGIAAIPVPLAAAMLAGVLLPVCLSPVLAVVELPAQAGPAVLAWAVLMRVARRWAVPGALVVTAIAIAVVDRPDLAGASLLPGLTLTAPTFDLGAVVSLGLPLFVVTMASQNVPGMAVLASFGYRPSLRAPLVVTGGATIAGAPFGAHAINLAALTAALVAGPEAGPDPSRRWVAAATGGAAYLALGLTAGVATVLVATAPSLLVEAVAGLALLGALAGSLATALGDPARRDAALVTFVVAASGITVAGVSAPFWGLLAGLAYSELMRR